MMNKAIIYLGLTLLVVAAQGCSTKQVEPKKNTLDIAINGLGGE
jgi:hypothetical protein